MKFRSRRLFSPSAARMAFRALRLLRQGASPHCDVRVERFALHRHKLLAAPIPKVASRTIQAMFAQASGPEPGTEPGTGYEIVCSPDDIARDFPDYFVFSFVRNPWSRVHSCWKDKIADAVTPGKLLILSRFDGLRPFMPFAEFVEWLDSDRGGDGAADRHWLSQTRHLSTGSGDRICDFVGKIEEFEAGLCRIEERTGVSLPRIPAQNVKAGGPGYQAAYDDFTRKIVARRYGEDIEAFEYRFG